MTSLNCSLVKIVLPRNAMSFTRTFGAGNSSTPVQREEWALGQVEAVLVSGG